MSLMKKIFFGEKNPHTVVDENSRKYQLIHTLTFELLIMGVVLISINLALKIWVVSALLGVGALVAVLNLILIKKNYSVALCGHIISSLCLALVTAGNFWSGGVASSFVGWYYIPPVIAAISIGLNGLVIYSLLSLSVISLFISGYLIPLASVPEHYRALVDNVNYIFIFLLIFTSLYSLLMENKEYEVLLKEQNFLLYSDKQKFHYLSHHDSLTNLPNRSYFHTHLQAIIDSSNITHNSITLYFMDLDGFKKINDKYGHEIGDLVLLHTSKRLQSCFRENDFIARLGGDEFTAVITHQAKDKIAELLMKRIEQEFSSPFNIKDLKLICHISVGMANYPLDALDAENLLKIADEAMYHNKKSKNQNNTQNI